jgi:hypothetical protein
VELFVAALVEFVLVEVLGTLVAWLPPIRALQRAVALQGCKCLFDSRPFASEQFLGSVRVDR